MERNIRVVREAINYIEGHLHEKPDLERVAEAVHYSKYHLHRMFTGTAGMTIQTYVQRRRLTEAAKLLVFSDRPILEIALSAGYESRQSFTDAFKDMYKKSPNRYRKEEEFYPLQLRYMLHENPGNLEEKDWQERITFAAWEDIPGWMELVSLVIDGFPHLDEQQYLAQLRDYIGHKRALLLKDGDRAIGIMAFHEMTGSIDFFGVHPQYRKQGIGRAFCRKVLGELTCPGQISVTTFREGDRADTGYREMWKGLGFTEGELLVEFGYPTQRFLLQNAVGGSDSQALQRAIDESGSQALQRVIDESGSQALQRVIDEPGSQTLQRAMGGSDSQALQRVIDESGNPVWRKEKSEGREDV